LFPHSWGPALWIFGQGTLKEVWYLIDQTKTVVGAPLNARITEDFSGLGRV
jgi:hypothetical protein